MVSNTVTAIRATEHERKRKVVSLLRQVADEIEQGETEATRCIICLLDEQGDDRYVNGYSMEGLLSTQAICLLEVTKKDLLRAMHGELY